MKKVEIKGIKQAISEYRNWLARDYFHTASIMLDVRTGEVWTDCFISCNSWIDYKSENIVDLGGVIRRFTPERFTMQLLKEYGTKILNKEIIYNNWRGWEYV